MMPLRLTLILALCCCAAQAVLSGKELKRREAGFDTYGPPPRPAPQYGPPPQQQHVPHREYGVPQQIPFREYGPPAIKYGPPKLNFLSGGGGGGGGGGLHEQIKTHFGVPKPFYGPPHIQHKPAPQYGPPPPKPAPQYGPPPQPAPQYGPPPPHHPAPQYGPPPPKPAPQYGPPPQPAPQYGPPPPQKIIHRPAPQYGPPKPQYGPPPPPPQSLPAPHAAPLFRPAHQPASSYGPPASGPLNLPPKQIFDAPPPNYGPPPLPVALPGPPPPATTIILSGGGGIGGGHSGPSGPGPVKQVQIQIDASGHTHSVSGSQAPFHTACDGWKPIPAPVGAYVEQNHIETQGGYSQVAQGHGGGFGTQYSSVGASGNGGSSIVDGLSDEQLVAVALQGGSDGGQVITGPGSNSIETEALQVAIGSLDDTYSKPPSDSYAPGSVHAQKYQTIGHSGPPPPPPGGNYGPPPPPPGGNYLPPPPPGGNYGPPPPPPQFAALTSSSSSSHAHSNSQSNVNIQYGPPPSGNPQPFPQHGAGQPNKPVAYRPPVPAGLLESIGATVQHLDLFGVKPAQQPSTYIPPAANEIALPGPPPAPLPAPQALYQPPPPPPQQQAPPQVIVQQQLPAPQPGPAFVHQQKQFGPPGPPPPPEPQYLPPPPVANVRPLGPPPPPPPSQQYLPAAPPPPLFFQQQQQQQQHHHHVENSYSASQYHSQGLPLPQQAPRFSQLPLQQPQQPQPIIIHDCGHGPNLVSSTGYQVQQQQQQQQQVQQQFGSISAASAGAYKAIAQSIPVAEQHTQQLVAGPADSYGPPPSGNDIDFDHTGYASQKNAVAALPDGTDPQQLPGLDGLDVLSAQKSQSIQLNGQQPTQNFQVQFGGSLNNAPGAATGDANHEEILSQGLLQSILTAIEQPNQQSLPQNHKAQSRSDEHGAEHAEDHAAGDAEDHEDGEEEQSVSSSNRVEVRVLPEDEEETPAEVKQIEPIVVNEEEEAKH
ncbi:proline-rich protein 12 [Drosophila bipectinata]|uniref:proline-rich protein 12 n=1 Tax=Drosophila bipectinata TaxID=42026 RepID=UPI001C89DC76|nr:trithorax group protein osa [Drosophila bipectinata]